MSDEHIERLLRKYLGISMPRVVLGILMILFSISIFAWPELVSYLVALYLLISGIIVIVDEYSKRYIRGTG